MFFFVKHKSSCPGLAARTNGIQYNCLPAWLPIPIRLGPPMPRAYFLFTVEILYTYYVPTTEQDRTEREEGKNLVIPFALENKIMSSFFRPLLG